MKFTFFVFSYNRGAFLKNCIDSILRNAPGIPIVVVDDDSNEPETLAVLNSLSAPARFLSRPRDRDGRYGGLYQNLQAAYETLEVDENFIFVQDDTQLVRRLEEEDWKYIADYFDRYQDAAFLNTCFLRGSRRRSTSRVLSPASEFPVYFYTFGETLKDRSVRTYYTDVCIGHVARLKQVNWSFGVSETDCARRARSHFGKMGLMANPFVTNIPEVPVYHGKTKTFAVRLSERALGTEPCRFRDMTESELSAFRARDLKTALPFGEDFLTCIGRQPSRPFHFHTVNARPHWRILHKLEIALKKLF